MKKILLITICLMSMKLTNAQNLLNIKTDKKSLKKDLKKVEKELKTLDEESIHYDWDFELEKRLKEKKHRDEIDKLLEDVEKLEKKL